MMVKTKLYGMLLGVVVILGVVFWVSGCTPAAPKGTDESSKQEESQSDTAKTDDLFKFYNLVELDQTRIVVAKNLGVTPEVKSDGDEYYKDEATGYGVMVGYDENNKVITKAVMPAEKAAKLIAMNPTPVTAEQVASITPGMTYAEVTQIMGSDGIEMVYGINSLDKNALVVGMVWFNPDLSTAIVYLNGPKGTVIDAAFDSV